MVTRNAGRQTPFKAVQAFIVESDDDDDDEEDESDEEEPSSPIIDTPKPSPSAESGATAQHLRRRQVTANRVDVGEESRLEEKEERMPSKFDDEEVELAPFLSNGTQVHVRQAKSSSLRRALVSLMPRRRTIAYTLFAFVLFSQLWIWGPTLVGQENAQAWGQTFDDWRPFRPHPPSDFLPPPPPPPPPPPHPHRPPPLDLPKEEGTSTIDPTKPIATSTSGNPIYMPKQNLPSEYDAPLLEGEEALSIDREAFPPQVVQYTNRAKPAKAVYNYRDGDPHQGEIGQVQLAILDRDIPRLAPVAGSVPPEYPASRWQAHTGWSRELNGSTSRMEDSLDPDAQPLEHDWRPKPFNEWRPFSFQGKLTSTRRRKAGPAMPKVQFPFSSPGRFSGEGNDRDRDAVLERRRRLVRNAFLHSWEAYKKNAWGHDEVRPVSGSPSDSFNGWGATIVDALDTLLVMELPAEYDLARQHVRDIDFHLLGGSRSAYGHSDGRVPVFETAIRYLGGFLSAYDLSGDELMRDRAEELAQLIMPAFETMTGVPVGRIRFDDKSGRPMSTSVIFAEAGSMLLEMTRLWQVTGNRTYFDRVHRITDWLQYNMTGSPGRLGALLPASLIPERGSFYGPYSWGGMIDSAFEYLIKEHQLLGGRVEQYGRFFADVVDSAHQWLLRSIATVPDTPLLVIGQSNGKTFTPKLEHLTCFAGGSIGLGAKLLNRPNDMGIAKRLSESCWWAYNSTATGIGPEEMTFYREKDSDRYEANTLAGGSIRRGRPRGAPVVGVRQVSADYRGRPETIESVFYMWRITGDRQWQERGWQMFCSWVTHSMSTFGFSSLGNVLQVPSSQTDSMESYVFAETFKYYYLLFSPPELVSLDDYVFTTEAHPILLPKNGQWAVPGNGPRRFWTPSMSKQTSAAVSGEYAGGELGPVGGLTRLQKHFLYETWQKELESARIMEEAAKEEAAALLKAEKAALAKEAIADHVRRFLSTATALAGRSNKEVVLQQTEEVEEEAKCLPADLDEEHDDVFVLAEDFLSSSEDGEECS